MLRFALAVLFISSTQVVLSLAGLKFTFTEVQQCEPLAFSFSGEYAKGSSRATSLSVIPFGANPVVVPIPNPMAITGSVFSTFLPFPEGTDFIASLEDARGATVINVSDVMRVLPSQGEAKTSCLDPNPPEPHFILEDSPSQCEEFTLSYNTTALPQPPRVRVYNPRGFSFILNQTFSDQISGTARYMMGVSQGRDVALLVDGGNGIRETTRLLTVGGDASSPTDCLARQREEEAAMLAASKSADISSKAIIIGSASGGGAVVLIAVIMCIFIIQERTKKRKARYTHGSFDGTRMQRGGLDEKGFPLPTFVVVSPSSEKNARWPQRAIRTDSLASWVQVTPDDQKEPASLRRPEHHSIGAPSLAHSETRNVMPRSVDGHGSRLSINSLDIEGMLNMATMQSEAARKSSTTTLFGPDTIVAPPQIRILTEAPRRRLKVNSDIPDDLRSVYSRDSVNPFSTLNDPEPSERRNPARDLLLASGVVSPDSPFARAGAGLPTSPRDVRKAPGRLSVSRSSRSSADWYAIAR